jgi:hypothetical protein
MRLYEYLLAEDARYDLHDLGAATSWLFGRPWWPQDDPDGSRTGNPGFWREEDQAAWQRNILALRSLARRLARKRVRHGFPDTPHDRRLFDKVLREHLARMRLVVRDDGRRVKGVRPALSRASFVGLTPWPTLEQGGIVTPMVPDVANFCRLGVFWQCVFYSLVSGDFAPACERCGTLLPARTKTGRASRQKLCEGCRWASWWARQPAARKRAKWRKDKRSQRE